MKRSNRKSLAEETGSVIQRGWYDHPSSGRVSIAPQVRACVTSTKLFLPNDLDRLQGEVLSLPGAASPAGIEVHNETTLQGIAHLLADSGGPVAALNFASAKNPGGGFLGGSQAQEESLARSSALYVSLKAAPAYYERHRGSSSCLYSDTMILSPDCPIFRDDEGAFLQQLHLATFLSSAAPNAGAIANNAPADMPLIPGVFQRRAERVLALAAGHGYRCLVLGAWGCGVFRNDPAMVAQTFADLLRPDGLWRCRFDRIVFSVLDLSSGETFACFRERLG